MIREVGMISKVNMLLFLEEYVAKEIMNYLQALLAHTGNSGVQSAGMEGNVCGRGNPSQGKQDLWGNKDPLLKAFFSLTKAFFFSNFPFKKKKSPFKKSLPSDSLQ